MSLMLILSMDFQGHSITAPPKVSNFIYMEHFSMVHFFFNVTISRKYIWSINLIKSLILYKWDLACRHIQAKSEAQEDLSSPPHQCGTQ